MQVVILAANSFDNDNVAPLAAAACHWKRLKHLDLSDNMLDPEAVRLWGRRCQW
jgi:Ran GTPase-activating protein (RanGAP) involved in mRNA processing and transport